MLITNYIANYLETYEQLNLPSICIFKRVFISSEINENNTINAPYYTFSINEPTDEKLDHFILYIASAQNKNFDEVLNEVEKEIKHIKSILNDNHTYQIEGIGSIRYLEDTLTLFNSALSEYKMPNINN